MPIKFYLQGASLVLLAALGFSLQPLFAREVYADGANALGLVWLRFLVPSVLLLVFIPAKTRRLRPGAGVLGMINGMASLCYFIALQQVTVSLTVMLLSLFPLLVFLQGWARRQESLTGSRLLALVGALAGVYFTLDGDFAGSWGGILFGLGAALFYSAYLVGAPRWMPVGDALGSSAWTLIGAALVFSVPAILGFADMPQTIRGWSAVLALGIVSTFIPFLLLIKGIGMLRRQFDVAIFSTLEPVASIFWAWLILHETLSENSLLGGVMVLGAALLMIWSQSRSQPACVS
ncbi:hypothetical protein A8C75_22785 [Marinobacterium aestuarii]|uniref:EamA domain-containing protein n=1 Tax=Marinobacterium aestuarii TaxID=1821621 RepID=A0A1A9F475_9GAMM|nr:DMT family transporter [Marinobacterium aestuarii]ANG65026.1 hypothetical protein A8C75_22785 [Marinobacterium aestuarii]